VGGFYAYAFFCLFQCSYVHCLFFFKVGSMLTLLCCCYCLSAFFFQRWVLDPRGDGLVVCTINGTS